MRYFFKKIDAWALIPYSAAMGMKKLKEALDNEYTWPASYTFKFVIKKGEKDKIYEILEKRFCTEKESRNGKYISVTCTKTMLSSQQVIETYEEIYEAIPTVIGL